MRMGINLAVVMIVGLLVAVMGLTSTAEAAKGKKKKTTERAIQGKVTNVDTTGKKFTIKLDGHGKKSKKKDAAATANEKTFTVNDDTKFTTGKKKESTTTTFSALKSGDHVSVVASGETAKSVKIHASKSTTKKKSKKAK